MPGCRVGQPFRAAFRASARKSRAEARLAGQKPCPTGARGPGKCYFTLATLMVSPAIVPVIVTCLPAIGVTFA